MQAAFLRIVEMIEAFGLERLREPHVKHLEGPLWEMRMSGRDGELNIARQRLKEVK